MENDSNTNHSLSSLLCTSGCGFFGNQQFDGMCSQCYKESLKRKQASSAIITDSHRSTSPQPSSSTSVAAISIPSQSENNTAITQQEEVVRVPITEVVTQDNDKTAEVSNEPKTKTRNRCHSCKKRVGLTGFECRCGGLYCGLHRYSDKHDCQFDYKKEAEETLRKNNPVVAGSKIQKL